MERKHRRRSFVVLATALSLVLSLNSVPSDTSVPQASPPPDLSEIAALEQIADWLLGADDFGSLELAELLDDPQRAQSFELFRHYTDEGSRRALLAGMPYGDAILATAEQYQLDGLLLAALVEVESSFLSQAVSPEGAVGLMQVLPSTASDFGVADLTDPETNLETGARYLAYLLERFDGHLGLALAAYNAGPGNVARYGGVPPFSETRAYVERVLSVYAGHHRNAWDASGATEMLLLR